MPFLNGHTPWNKGLAGRYHIDPKNYRRVYIMGLGWLRKRNERGIVSDLKRPYRALQLTRVTARLSPLFILSMIALISCAQTRLPMPPPPPGMTSAPLIAGLPPRMISYFPRDSSSEWNGLIICMAFQSAGIDTFEVDVDGGVLFRLRDSNYLNMAYANGGLLDRDPDAPENFTFIGLIDDARFPTGWHDVRTLIRDTIGFRFSSHTLIELKRESTFVMIHDTMPAVHDTLRIVDVHQDTVRLSAGWNLLATDYPTTTATITTEPPGIFSSPFYGYNGVYYSAMYLVPNAGYWIKVRMAGKAILYRISPQASPHSWNVK